MTAPAEIERRATQAERITYLREVAPCADIVELDRLVDHALRMRAGKHVGDQLRGARMRGMA